MIDELLQGFDERSRMQQERDAAAWLKEVLETLFGNIEYVRQSHFGSTVSNASLYRAEVKWNIGSRQAVSQEFESKSLRGLVADIIRRCVAEEPNIASKAINAGDFDGFIARREAAKNPPTMRTLSAEA